MRLAAGAILLAALTPASQAAEDAGPFAGKTVTVYLAGAPGGGYDAYGRLVARHIGRHLPGNPTVVASNMPGGNGLIAANYMFNVARRDGTAISMPVQNLAEEQLLGRDGVKFDAKQFSWVGRVAPNSEIMYVWHAAGVRNFNDLKTRETIFAGQGPSAVLYPTLLNAFAGTKVKIVRGYQGVPNIHLAMERGEVEGMTGSVGVIMATVPDWVREGKVVIVLQYQDERHPDLPDVPAAPEVIPDAGDRRVFSFFASSASVGRAMLAPPEVPQDMLTHLRRGFDAMMKNPEFIADAKKARFELGHLSGEALQSLVERQLNLDPALRERVRSLAIR